MPKPKDDSTEEIVTDFIEQNGVKKRAPRGYRYVTDAEGTYLIATPAKAASIARKEAKLRAYCNGRESAFIDHGRPTRGSAAERVQSLANDDGMAINTGLVSNKAGDAENRDAAKFLAKHKVEPALKAPEPPQKTVAKPAMRLHRTCEECGKPLDPRKRSKFCSEAHETKFRRRSKTREAADRHFEDAATTAMRFNNCVFAAEFLSQSAKRCGFDNVSFVGTPRGVIAFKNDPGNGGAPMLPAVTMVVQVRVEHTMLCGKKELWHEHLIDLAPLSEIEHSSNAPDVIAAITGAQGRKFGFSLIEQERERERLAILDSLASGPERQILIYTLDEAAQLSYEYDGEGIPIDARIKNYCFEGDPVLDRWRRWQAEDEAEDEIWASPTLTPSEEALIDAEMLAMSDKIPKGINKPQYTHPDRRTLPEANHGVGRQIHRQPRWAREMSAPSSRRRRKSPVSAKIKLTN